MSRWLCPTLFFSNKMKFEDWPMARSHQRRRTLPNFKIFIEFFLDKRGRRRGVIVGAF